MVPAVRSDGRITVASRFPALAHARTLSIAVVWGLVGSCGTPRSDTPRPALFSQRSLSRWLRPAVCPLTVPLSYSVVKSAKADCACSQDCSLPRVPKATRSHRFAESMLSSLSPSAPCPHPPRSPASCLTRRPAPRGHDLGVLIMAYPNRVRIKQKREDHDRRNRYVRTNIMCQVLANP